MDMLFDLGLENEVADLRDRLRAHFGDLAYGVMRSPIGALVKSIISCRTKDEVSLRTYGKLVATWPDWHDMAAAGSVAVSAVIQDVTLAEREAGYVCAVLKRIGASHPDFNLDFLGAEPVGRAIAWLERLPGVGRKVSAATLISARCSDRPWSSTPMSSGFCSGSAWSAPARRSRRPMIMSCRPCPAGQRRTCRSCMC